MPISRSRSNSRTTSPRDDLTTNDDQDNSHNPGERTPLPKFQLFIVILIQVAEPITATVIFPFIYALVRRTGVTGGDEAKVGYYAGLIESAFFLSESLTTLIWGRASDIYGRKPVLVLGPLGLGLSMIGFGLSNRFYALVIFRFCQGAFNGNIGVSKSVMAELSDATNMADIFALLSPMWSLGVIIGPFMGGSLAEPASQWPSSILAKTWVFVERPYFLSCLAAGCLAFVSFLCAVVGLRETLPSAMSRKSSTSRASSPPSPETEALLDSTEEQLTYGSVNPQHSSRATPANTSIPLRQLFTTRQVLIPLINYCILAFFQMANSVLMPIVWATTIPNGGLSLSPQKIGKIMGFWGVFNCFFQMIISPRVVRYIGPRNAHGLALIAIALGFWNYIFASLLAKGSGKVDGAVWTVVAWQLLCVSCQSIGYVTGHMYVADSAPNRESLGSVNGLTQTVSTGLRCLAPIIANSLFSASIDHKNTLGGYFVFVLFGCVCGALASASRLLPKQLRRTT